MTSVAILGPGGVGGFVAGAFERAGIPVTVVAREDTAALIARDGIRVESVRLGDTWTARPRAVSRLEEPADYLVVAPKYTTLAESLGRIAAEPGMVVPMLNGLDHLAVLRERFGDDRVAAASIRIESDRPEPGHIVQTSPFLRVDMTPPAAAFADLLERAEIPARVLDSEAQVMWGKLVRLNALALTTSATDRLLGFIRTDPEWRAKLEACAEEASAVARAEGADVTAAATMAELDDAHETLGSSMQRDIAAGREPELDAIPGSVLRAAARHGIECPTIEGLMRTVADRLPALR
ncbi:MAG: ketopantoate reductase family protein [Thermoleophilaceae bacterium]